MPLPNKSPPDPLHAGGGKVRLVRRFPRSPTISMPGLSLPDPDDRGRHNGIMDLPRVAGANLVMEPVEARRRKPFASCVDGLGCQPKRSGHHFVASAVGAPRNAMSPCRHPLPRLRSTARGPELDPLRTRRVELHHGATGHRHLLCNTAADHCTNLSAVAGAAKLASRNRLPRGRPARRLKAIRGLTARSLSCRS
jgi:hypothetical protein